jgi:GxxExxY protein
LEGRFRGWIKGLNRNFPCFFPGNQLQDSLSLEMQTDELKYGELTGKVIGSAMRVHSFFGPGFPEVVYKRAMVMELHEAGLCFRTEAEREIFYRGALIGKRKLDLLVEDKLLVELKATSEVPKSGYNQIINYLKVFNIEVGLLLNFGAGSLQFKRFVR